VRFALLQGETAKERLPEKFRTLLLSTLVVWEDGRVSVESDGLAAIAYRMPGLHGRMARALTRPFVRQLLSVDYRLIARTRHRWFGITCQLVPDPDRLLP
jgi:predicted DCC family thiol-disulfide oxidoreductase YuxK